MPREPRMKAVRNPMAQRRGFIAFVVRGLEFQTYFDPITMTAFGLGQSDEPVRIRTYPEGREPYNLERESSKIDRARMKRRNELMAQRRRKRNPESRRDRMRRFD